MLLRNAPTDQDGHFARLVSGICLCEPIKELLLVGMHGCVIRSMPLGHPMHSPAQLTVSPTQSHLGILRSKQMLLAPRRNALLRECTSHLRRVHVLAAAEDDLEPPHELAEEDGDFNHIWCRYSVSASTYPNPHLGIGHVPKET